MDFHGFSWIFMDFHGFPWLFAKHLSKVQVSRGLVWHTGCCHCVLWAPPGSRRHPSYPTNGYGSIPINTIFSGMNIHLPAGVQGFDMFCNMNYYNSIHHVNENYIDLKVGSRFSSSCFSQCRRQRRSQKGNCQIAAQLGSNSHAGHEVCFDLRVCTPANWSITLVTLNTLHTIDIYRMFYKYIEYIHIYIYTYTAWIL